MNFIEANNKILKGIVSYAILFFRFEQNLLWLNLRSDFRSAGGGWSEAFKISSLLRFDWFSGKNGEPPRVAEERLEHLSSNYQSNEYHPLKLQKIDDWDDVTEYMNY